MMQEAYSLLYDIEMIIVHHIVDCYKNYYGDDFLTRLVRVKFNYLYYSQRIQLFNHYPDIFPHIEPFYTGKLLNLKDVRNKIAHMQPLTQAEFKQLQECHELVNKIMSDETVNS